MPLKNKEARLKYIREWKAKKRREVGLKKKGRQKLTEEERLLSKIKKEIYQKEWRRDNPWSSRNIVKRMLWNAKKRAKEKNIIFSISEDDIILPEFCPFLGIKLTTSNIRGTSRRDVASLDRIDPTKGYVKGNVEVISHLANSMKNNASPEDLLSFAREIIKRYG